VSTIAALLTQVTGRAFQSRARNQPLLPQQQQRTRREDGSCGQLRQARRRAQQLFPFSTAAMNSSRGRVWRSASSRHDGRPGSLFRITGNRTKSRSFRASLALAALHSHTILTRRVQTGTAPHNAPTGKEDKLFLTRRGWRIVISLMPRQNSATADSPPCDMLHDLSVCCSFQRALNSGAAQASFHFVWNLAFRRRILGEIPDPKSG